MDVLRFPPDRMKQAGQYAGLVLARVISQHKNLYTVMTERGQHEAELPGSYLYTIRSTSEYPAVGDYVLIDQDTSGGHAIIHKLLERTSVFARKAAGEGSDEQIIAANIDMMFICMALNHDFNPRRLERYLAIAWESGADPIIVLTKADLCHDVAAKLVEVQDVLSAPVPVYVVSSGEAAGYDELVALISPGKTIAFVGSSGVGKSTLINRLRGDEAIATAHIRTDGRGRHTTTRRDLYVLPSGAMVIDTPGMRELGLNTADVQKTFGEIADLAESCRFADCKHQQEPGCAVRIAVKHGELSAERLESYQKLLIEAGYEGLNSRQIQKAKTDRMFAAFDGKKNVKKYLKSKQKRI